MSTQPSGEIGVSMIPGLDRISVSEYLRTSYRPDRELIDGELREKPMPTRLHGFVQAMIGHWFGMHMDEWGVAPESEVRTRVRPENFRLPDVAITRLESMDSNIQETPPLIVIEILSDDDRYVELCRRASDFSSMGVENVWLVDPEQRAASVCQCSGSWEPAKELQVRDTPVHLDLHWLWAQVDKRISQS